MERNGNTDGETQEKPKEHQMMLAVATSENASPLTQITPDPLQKSFRMRSLTPSFPSQLKKQSLILGLAWKKFGNKCNALPDDPEEEIPWYEQEEELK